MRSVVQIYLGPPVEGAATGDGEDSGPGGVAQLGERLPCTQEVIGSIPLGSMTDKRSVYRLFYQYKYPLRYLNLVL